MANYGWQDIDIISVDGFNVQPMNVIDIEIPKPKAAIEKLHGAGNQFAKAYDTGIRMADGDVVLRMPYDYDGVSTTDDSYEAFVTNAHKVDGVVAIGVEGNVKGAKVWFFSAHNLDYSHEPGQETLTKTVATWTVNGQIHPGLIVTTLRTVTADGDSESTSLNNAASTATGGYAMLHAGNVVLDGGTALQVDVRHSADNVTFADLVAFTAVSADRAGEIKNVATGTTVNQYLAAQWDFTGSPGAGATADVFVAFKRGQ